MTYKHYKITDIFGNVTLYEATDIRMAITVHEQLTHTEVAKAKLVGTHESR